MDENNNSGLAWLFPVGAFILLPSAFFICYGIGVARNDIEVFWPYISDTGASPPESCIFAQLVNMSAGLTMVSLYLRHRHIMAMYKTIKHRRKAVILSSRVFLGIGTFAAFGLMLVANFQEDQIDVSVVHYVGAFIAFVLGLAYAWYQTVISFMTPIHFTPRRVAWIRLVISILGVVFFVGLFARQMMDGYAPLPTADPNSTVSHSLHYYRGPGDPGYTAFLVTTISEWCLAMCLPIFFLTLAFDMKTVRAHPPRFSLYVVDKSDRTNSANVSEPAIRQPPLFTGRQEMQPHSQRAQLPDQTTRLAEVRWRPEPVAYEAELKNRIIKIPLPGLTSLDNRWRKSNGGSLAANSDYEERRPRGLRRSYMNVTNPFKK